MKKLITILFFVVFISELSSQVVHEFSLGPFFGLKAGINGGNVAERRKNAISFNEIPDFGVTAYYPMGEENDIGLTFDLAMTTYSFSIISDLGQEPKPKYTERLSYITLSPNFHYIGFLMGFNFGIPLFGTVAGDDVHTSTLNTVVEFRIGYMYPLLADESGSLNAFVQAGYMLTGMFSDFEINDPLLYYIPADPSQPFTSKYNPRAVSLSLGLNYLFNL